MSVRYITFLENLLLLLFSLQTWSLAETCTWTNITTRPEVNAVAAAGDYVWVGTRYSGLVKIHVKTGDTEFFTRTNSGLPDNKIRSLATHATDEVWVIAGKKLGRFRKNAWIIVEYPVFGKRRYSPTVLCVTGENEVWVGGVVIEDITPDKDPLGMNRGKRHPVLLRYKENVWTVFDSTNSPVNSEIRGIAGSNSGTVCVGVGSSLCTFNGTKWIENDSLQLPSQFDGVVGVAIDAADVTWICTRKHVVRMNGDERTVWGRTALGIPEGEKLVDVAVGSGGKVLVGYHEGFSCFKDTSWNAFNDIVPEDESVTSIVFDVDENVWFGGSFGVRKFDGKRYTEFRTTMSPVSKRVTCLAIDADGTKWLGTDGDGLVMFDGEKWTTFSTGLQDTKIECISIDSSRNKWVGTETGLHAFDGNRWHLYKYDKKYAKNHVEKIAIDHSGTVWTVMSGSISVVKSDKGGSWCSGRPRWYGLLGLHGKMWTVYDTSNSGILFQRVTTIATTQDGTLWAGFCKSFAPAIDEVVISVFHAGKWTNYAAAEIFKCTGQPRYGYSPVELSDMACDKKGNLWVGAVAGVAKYVDGKWCVYDSCNSLLREGFRHSLAVDSVGTVWVGSSYGLIRFSGKRWTLYDRTNSGFPGSAFNLVVDKQNRIWFCTDNGIAMMAQKHN